MAALNGDVFEYAEFQVDEQDPNQHVDWKVLPKWQADRVAAGEGTMHLGPGSLLGKMRRMRLNLLRGRMGTESTSDHRHFLRERRRRAPSPIA